MTLDVGLDAHDVATARMRRLTNPVRPMITLPTGVKVAGVDCLTFTVTITAWQTDWLRGHDQLPDEQRYVLWGGPWADETTAAALDPTSSDVHLGRLMLEDIAATAAKAVIHEFLEFGAINGRKLWDAHIPMGGPTITKRIADQLASDPDPLELA